MCICENQRILKDFILFKMLLIADFITCYYADIGEGGGGIRIFKVRPFNHRRLGFIETSSCVQVRDPYPCLKNENSLIDCHCMKMSQYFGL